MLTLDDLIETVTIGHPYNDLGQDNFEYTIRRYHENGIERIKIPVEILLPPQVRENDKDSLRSFLFMNLSGIRRDYFRQAYQAEDIMEYWSDWPRHLFFLDSPEGDRYVISGPLFPESSRIKLDLVKENDKLEGYLDTPLSPPKQVEYIENLLIKNLNITNYQKEMQF